MSRQYVPWVGIRDPFYKDQERQHQVQLRRIDNRTRGGIPVCAEKHPSHGNKVLGGNDGKGHNETTPVVKTGVGDVLQISSWMNSNSLLGDCRTGELAVIEIRIESVLCEQLLMGALFNDRTVVHDKSQRIKQTLYLLGILECDDSLEHHTDLTVPAFDQAR